MTPTGIPYRRIGAILVERGAITETQLAEALDRQRHAGGQLGEILVVDFGVSRLELADALAEQWSEIEAASVGGASPEPADEGSEPAVEPQRRGIAEGDLRQLLEEAEAARSELALRTDELSKRLESLESLVAGVTRALGELQETTPAGVGRVTSVARRRRTRSAA